MFKITIRKGLLAVGVPLIISSILAVPNAFADSTPKVVFSVAAITDSTILKDRALNGITDDKNVTINTDVKKSINTQENLTSKAYTTAQKLKETDYPDGTKVTEYRQTSFILISKPTVGSVPTVSKTAAMSFGHRIHIVNKAQNANSQTTWDPTYSWEAKVTMNYNQYSSGSFTYDQLVSGSAEWDAGGQTTNLPAISNAAYTNGAIGSEPSGNYFQQQDQTWLGSPNQYWTFTKNESWPYVATAGALGEIATSANATLTYGGSAWTWKSTVQVGNATYCC